MEQLKLCEDNFFRTKYDKSLIVLHHTCGSSANGAISHWNSDKKSIATAYIIEKNGAVIELFNPEYWSYHLGIKGLQGRHDKRSIGIELVNEGPIADDHAGSNGRIYDHKTKWRGYRTFAEYTEKQMISVINLINRLCKRFDIPKKTPQNHLVFDPELIEFRGVVGHHHLRADKSDLHPGFDWERLSQKCHLVKISIAEKI